MHRVVFEALARRRWPRPERPPRRPPRLRAPVATSACTSAALEPNHTGFLVTSLVGLALAGTGACAKNKVQTPAPPVAQPRRDEPAPRPQGPPLLLRGGRIMTATGEIIERGDVLIRGATITAVGAELEAPPEARVIELEGRTVTPGLIDTHSHIGVYPAPHFDAHADGNEVGSPVTANIRAGDGYWPQDPQIDRARAGGVTTMQILPGSANLIGGRSLTVKLYPDARSADDARFPGAPFGVKMACGENPKRVYGDDGHPRTRMGNIAGFRDAFQDALEYRIEWDVHRKAVEIFERNVGGKNEKDPPKPPERDFGLETLVAVLEGRALVHNHCYRADEMSIMMDLAEEFGFKIRSFHHAVEAYKIADRLAEHGASASVWADWWGFKAEAFDGIRENAAIVAAAGGIAIIHSDSAIGIQQLNQEAAKAMYAGRRAGLDIDENEALRWITANPAWALGIDDEVGTIEPDKHADLVIWDGDPFSVHGRPEQVFIEGRVVYADDYRPSTDFELGYEMAESSP